MIYLTAKLCYLAARFLEHVGKAAGLVVMSPLAMLVILTLAALQLVCRLPLAVSAWCDDMSNDAQGAPYASPASDNQDNAQDKTIDSETA